MPLGTVTRSELDPGGTGMFDPVSNWHYYLIMAGLVFAVMLAILDSDKHGG